MSQGNSQQAKDIAYLLHPYMDVRRHEKEGPVVISRGQGIYVYDDDGKEYIEGLAGLWSVAVGFSEKRLVDAATEQLKRLPYYHIFGNKTHNPAVELSEKLIALAGNRTRHVFYTNSGSEANDTAVKLVWYYNNSLGRPNKKKIVSRQRAYHGVTIAAASATGLPANHRDFDLPIARFVHTSSPHYWRNAKQDESEQAFSMRMASELEVLILAEGPETVAAFIGEPVMGAGGVIVPPAGYWKAIQAVCRKYDILLIADEVITGFGRTGEMFGSDLFGIDPDIMVLSKQLTSSYQPLAAVLISDPVYQAIGDNSARIGTLGHGYTTSGHPVATAVALENIKIIEERNFPQRARELSPELLGGLQKFANHPLVGEVRGVGLIAAVEFVREKNVKSAFDPVGRVGAYAAKQCQEEGLIVRAIGDTIAFCPPMIIEAAQIKEVIARFSRALDQTFAWYETEFGQA
jgi:4-aminobutyrate--pyruvate transaminase